MFFRDIIPPRKKSPCTLIFSDQREKVPTPRFRAGILIFFSIGLIIFILTVIHVNYSGIRLKHSIATSAFTGFQKIMGGISSLQESKFETAQKLFQEAQELFKNIEYHAWFVPSKLSAMKISDPLFNTVQALTTAGDALASAGIAFVPISRNLQVLLQQFFAANHRGNDDTQSSLTEKLKEQLTGLRQANASLMKAKEAMKNIDSAFIPSGEKERFQFAQDALKILVSWLTRLETDTPALLRLLGDSEPHVILVLLQNNSELRPTGGFIGNFILLELHHGYLRSTEVFDVYSADHALQEVITPPEEILPVNKRWFLRDSNYSGHFPLSAAKALWFLEKETTRKAETVIGLDQSLVADLLELTGPIQIPELTSLLTAKNFATILSYIIESKLSGREDPKALMKSFVPEFQKALFKNTNPLDVLAVLRAAGQSKHILAYSSIPEIQSFFEYHGLAGLMFSPASGKQDYLNIVHSSIGGNKSDAYITETILHDTYLQFDGSIVNELTITRRHGFSAQSERKLKMLLKEFGFSEIPKKVLEILGRSRNLHKLRIYVPLGSVLEKTSDAGVETHIDPEIGRTYFSATMEVPVGEKKGLRIRYRLPYQLDLDPVNKYDFFIQKQPGQNNIFFQKRIFSESKISNHQYFPKEGSLDADGVWNFETELGKDLRFVSLWGK